MPYIIYYDVTYYEMVNVETAAELSDHCEDKAEEFAKSMKDKQIHVYTFAIKPEPINSIQQQTPTQTLTKPQPEED